VGVAVSDRPGLARREGQPAPAQDQCGLGATDDEVGKITAASRSHDLREAGRRIKVRGAFVAG
jgi:hypothetical protein